MPERDDADDEVGAEGTACGLEESQEIIVRQVSRRRRRRTRPRAVHKKEKRKQLTATEIQPAAAIQPVK